MRAYFPVLAAAVLTVASASTARAQTPAPPTAEQAQKLAIEAAKADEARRKAVVFTPLKVQLVISKYQGEKKTSSLPYTLSVNADDKEGARLRMGAQVPLPIAATPVVENKTIPYGGPVQYREIGTNIDCVADSLSDGRFRLALTIEDSSIYADDNAAAFKQSGSIPPPAIRSFRLSNTAILKDGQSTQFSTATDKLSGEVTKIDVTLTVVK